MAARWKLDRDDLWSVVRHTIIPAISGVIAGAIQAMPTGEVNVATFKAALSTAAVAGLLRLFQTLATNKPTAPVA